MLIEKEEEIETLRKIFANISSSQEEGKENIKKLMLQQLGIIKTIVSIPTEANQHLLSRLMALNENKANVLIDWQNIFQMIDLVYDGFYTQLNNRYSGILNEKEIQLCCLLKANFSTKEINMLTRQSLQTIYQRKTQIRQKLSIPEKTLERHIKILRDAGLIEYKGSPKKGGYYIVHDRDASNEGITEGINRGINEGINTADTNKE